MPDTSQDFPTDYYWATEDEDEELLSHLNLVNERFEDAIYGSLYLSRIRRNYRYYHGEYYRDSDEPGDLEITAFGPDTSRLGTHVNQFRSLIQQYLILTTQYEPAWDTKAINTDPESLHGARLGNSILDYYATFKNVNRVLRRAAETALIFNVAYVYTYWDGRSGDMIPVPGTLGQSQREGDVVYRVINSLDCAYDLAHEHWDDVQYVTLHMKQNRWDLIARYSHLKEKLLEDFENDSPRGGQRRSRMHEPVSDDLVRVQHFYHRPSDALPTGRYVWFCGDTLLEQGPWEKDLPIDRISAGEQAGTCLGYSPANDLQGLQEWYNGELSNILTAHTHLGEPYVWGGPSGAAFEEKMLSDGLKVIFAPEKPEPMRLLDTPKEVVEMPAYLVMTMEQVVGINAVSRGQPEANLRSGKALAMVDAKSQQAASFFENQYYRMREGVGTKTLRLLAEHGGDHERTLAIVGRHNKIYMDQFVASALSPVNRVMVQSTDALSKTAAGREEKAQTLLKFGMIRTPEEYFNVQETGQLESMLEFELSELALLHEENARLLEGEALTVNHNDNHVLHIREHNALLGSVEMRKNGEKSAHILAHIMQHIQMLMDPNVQMLQRTLGYTVPGFYVDVATAMATGNAPQEQQDINQGANDALGGQMPNAGVGNPAGNPGAEASADRVPTENPF